MWGCDKPSQVAVEEDLPKAPDGQGGVNVYRICPMRRIVPSVGDFMEELKDMAEYPTTVKPLRERSPRFRAFSRIYSEAQAEVAMLAKKGDV